MKKFIKQGIIALKLLQIYQLLIKKNYKIIILSSTIKLKKNIIIIDPSNKDNHIDQFYLINYCDLYVGPLWPVGTSKFIKKK